MTPPSTAPYKRKQIAPGAPAVLVENERRNEIPAVISIPHSGEYITPQMQKALRKDVLLPNMDWYLKELYGFLSQLGYTVVANNMSRYVADPNRSPEQNQGEGRINTARSMRKTPLAGPYTQRR